MSWAIISVLALIAAVVISNVKNINIGLVGIALAYVVGMLGGMPLRDIYTGFGTQLFLRMLSLQCLIAIARNNGTLKVMANAVLKVCGGKLFRFMPIIVWVLCGLASWFAFGINTLMIPVIIALAFELGFDDPLKLGFVLICNALAFNYSPYTSTALNLVTYTEMNGLDVNMWSLGMVQFICGAVMFIGFYFYYGWQKEKAVEIDKAGEAKLNRNHILTFLGYGVFVVANLAFKIDMMVTPLVVAVILLILGAADAPDCVRAIPWNTLIMIGGMAVLVGVIEGLGGITLIANGVVAIANKTIAPAVMNVICGLMSMVSSANSVVIPTMTTAIPDIAAAIPGVDVKALVYAVGIGSFATAISPLSSVGGYIMSAHGTCYNPDESGRMKVFNKLMVYAGISLVTSTLLALVGLYSVHIFG